MNAPMPRKIALTLSTRPTLALLLPYLFLALWLVFWLGIRKLRSEYTDFLTLESLVVTSEGGLLLMAALALFFFGYLLSGLFSARFVVCLHALTAAVLLSTKPLLSSDVYLYAARGRLLSLYGLNPYEYVVNSIWFDPIIPFVFPGWLDKLQPYGPVWSSFSAMATWLTAGSIDATLFAFQLLGAIACSLCLLTLYSPSEAPESTSTNSIRETDAAHKQAHIARLYLFAANPLILVEAINNAHNDIWMLCFILLALRAYNRYSYALVLPYLTLASLIKAPALLLIPLAFVALLRLPKSIRPSSTLLVLLPLVVALVSLAPYVESQRFLEGIQAVGELNREFIAFIGTPVVAAAYLWKYTGYQIVSPESSLLLGRGLFLGMYLYLLFRSKESLTRRCELLLFWLLALAANVFLPWYALWVTCLAAARGHFRSCFWWTCIGLLAYYYGYATAHVFLCSLVPIGIWIALERIMKRIRHARSAEAMTERAE